MEPGGKGSFQAVKLQRPARTTVCSHSTRDMAAIDSIESKQDHDVSSAQLSVRLCTVHERPKGLPRTQSPSSIMVSEKAAALKTVRTRDRQLLRNQGQ